MYKKIRNPENNKLININTKLGHIILKKYLYSLYGGNPEKNVFMPDEGWVTTSPETNSDQNQQIRTPDTNSSTPEPTYPTRIDTTHGNLIQTIINQVHHFNLNGIDTYLQTHETLLNIFNYFDNNIDETVDALIENPHFTVPDMPLRNNVVRSLQFQNL